MGSMFLVLAGYLKRILMCSCRFIIFTTSVYSIVEEGVGHVGDTSDENGAWQLWCELCSHLVHTVV